MYTLPCALKSGLGRAHLLKRFCQSARVVDFEKKETMRVTKKSQATLQGLHIDCADRKWPPVLRGCTSPTSVVIGLCAKTAHIWGHSFFFLKYSGRMGRLRQGNKRLFPSVSEAGEEKTQWSDFVRLLQSDFVSSSFPQELLKVSISHDTQCPRGGSDGHMWIASPPMPLGHGWHSAHRLCSWAGGWVWTWQTAVPFLRW